MSPAPFWRVLFDFFFPPKCPLCGENPESPPGEDPCPACLSRIKYFSSPRCPRCGISFVSPSQSDHLCSECLTEERYFTKARAVCLYEGPIVEAISRFKYGGTLFKSPASVPKCPWASHLMLRFSPSLFAET